MDYKIKTKFQEESKEMKKIISDEKNSENLFQFIDTAIEELSSDHNAFY